MTPQHIELIQSTIPVLRQNGEMLTRYFYQRMLKHRPELKNTFNLDHQNSGRQPRALASAVLAYAEHIEDPTMLNKAIQHISTKHVSLNIQPEQYTVVGEHLLHSISEVLKVPMDSEFIQAWKVAYLQLADIFIQVEKQKYQEISTQNGGWSGWRMFEIIAIKQEENGEVFTVSAVDQKITLTAKNNAFISVKVKVPDQEIEQPYQYKIITQPLNRQINNSYQFIVQPEIEHSEFSVSNILLSHYKVGDQLQLTAPQAR